MNGQKRAGSEFTAASVAGAMLQRNVTSCRAAHGAAICDKILGWEGRQKGSPSISPYEVVPSRCRLRAHRVNMFLAPAAVRNPGPSSELDDVGFRAAAKAFWMRSIAPLAD
jgi:hypothetical protein